MENQRMSRPSLVRVAAVLAAAALALLLIWKPSWVAAAPQWTAIEKWTGTYTITILYRGAIERGTVSIFQKAESTATLDKKESYVDPSGAVHATWSGDSCETMSAVVEEASIQTYGNNLSTRVTKRGKSSDPKKDCGGAVVAISSDSNTYDISFPLVSVSTEQVTIISAPGITDDKEVVESSTHVGPQCCSDLPLPGPGMPLRGSKTFPLSAAEVIVPAMGREDPVVVVTWELDDKPY